MSRRNYYNKNNYKNNRFSNKRYYNDLPQVYPVDDRSNRYNEKKSGMMFIIDGFRYIFESIRNFFTMELNVFFGVVLGLVILLDLFSFFYMQKWYFDFGRYFRLVCCMILLVRYYMKDKE